MSELANLTFAELIMLLEQERSDHNVTKSRLAAAKATINTLRNDNINIQRQVHMAQATPSGQLATITAVAAGIGSLSLEEGDTIMEVDDGIKMPEFKKHCDKEYIGSTEICTYPRCKYIHQAQSEKFEAAAIEALPFDRNERFARRRAGGF